MWTESNSTRIVYIPINILLVVSNKLENKLNIEFFKILEMGLYDEATKILVGPAWEKRELILSKIDQISLRHRQNLATSLAAGGFDVMIPGTTVNVAN